MEDNRKRLTYTQTQYIIAIIWHRIIREASVLTFYPGKVGMIRELTNVKQNMSVIKFQDNNYLSIEEIDRIISDVATL